MQERPTSEHTPVDTLLRSSELNVQTSHSNNPSRPSIQVRTDGSDHVDAPARFSTLESPTLVSSPIEFRDSLWDNTHSQNANVSPSRNQRLGSGWLQLTPGPSTPQEPPWSLFGQLMESEGQLRRLDSQAVRKRPSNGFGYPQPSLSGFSETLADPSIAMNAQQFSHIPRLIDHSQESRAPMQAPVNIPDYDSNTSQISADPIPVQRCEWLRLDRLYTLPTVYRNILKCAVAYFIASLFTFSPYLSGFISDITSYGSGERRPSPSGHMVATIAVYFNPAKTLGAMIEADVYCVAGLIYTGLVCLCSMSMFWWLEGKPGWEWLAVVLLILWIGVSMSGIAWMKVWIAKPSFNTASSMMAIILFIVIVKEGGLETLLQVYLIVLIGSVVTNLVCCCIWPQSARVNLQGNMIRTLDSFSTLLQILTNTFLLEESLRQPSREKLQKAVDDHQSSFTTLKKNLAEAHSEWFYGGPTGPTHKCSGAAYQDAVDSLNRLAQHLNGLRSGTRLQYELTKARGERKRHRRTQTDGRTPEHNGKGKIPDRDGEASLGHDDDPLLDQATAIFGDLVNDLSSPLKTLSSTCSTSLKRLREAFAGQQRMGHDATIINKPQEFHQLGEEIENALTTFESISNDTVMRHYLKSELPSSNSVYSVMEEDSTYIGSDSEHIFLVYFFIFTLQEFAREVVSLVDAMARICSIERERSARAGWWKRIFLGGAKSLKFQSSSRHSAYDKFGRRRLQRSLSSMVLSRGGHSNASFPGIQPHAPNTIQTPSRSQLTFIGRVKQELWALGSKLKERHVKYAIKAGMATGILAAPAFFDRTRPLFTEYRGEWALVSFFVVISPTIGATNFMSVNRILGTLFGAGMAAGIFTLYPDNPVVLSVFGFFFSLPCFYYIVATPEHAPSGRFVLLTYNLTCLFCYNLREADVSVIDVAFHRSVSVTVGVVWAVLVSRLWWPSEARRELSKALGEFCLNIGWLYTRLAASNSFSPEGRDLIGDPSQVGGGTLLLSRLASTRLKNSIREFMSMELHLQIKLIELEGLLAQTQHEPRLKGPFPVALYRSILISLQSILDKLHSMRCVTTREEWLTSVRQDFIIPVNKERREMVGNIILSFSTLASAFRVKAPLPPYLPPAEQSRQRLVDAIRKLDVVKNRDVKGSRHLLFFAYALTMKGVTHELEYLGGMLQDAFGVIGPSREEFEALFGMVMHQV